MRGKLRGIGIRGKMYVENDEKDDGMCEKCCDAGRRKLKYVDISHGLAQGCTLAPNLFNVLMT